MRGRYNATPRIKYEDMARFPQPWLLNDRMRYDVVIAGGDAAIKSK